MTNLEKSEIVIASILSLLIERGIKQNELDFVELELDPNEFGAFFFSCINWLESEGVIRIEGVDRFMGNQTYGVVINPALTSYGLKILGQKFEVGGQEETLAATVMKVNNSGANYSNAGNFFGGFLGALTKSISS